MPNSQYIIKGRATPELIKKMKTAKDVFFRYLCPFCNEYRLDINEIAQTEKVFLVGSQAGDSWNENSDLDLVLVNSITRISNLYSYKYKLLDPRLNCGKMKKDWIDLYFSKDEEEISAPRWDVSDYW